MRKWEGDSSARPSRANREDRPRCPGPTAGKAVLGRPGHYDFIVRAFRPLPINAIEQIRGKRPDLGFRAVRGVVEKQAGIDHTEHQ